MWAVEELLKNLGVSRLGEKCNWKILGGENAKFAKRQWKIDQPLVVADQSLWDVEKLAWRLKDSLQVMMVALGVAIG